MAAVAVVPLIDKADGEDKLSGRAKGQQPYRHLVVVEECLDESGSVRQHHGKGSNRKTGYSNPCDLWYVLPHAFDVQVPYIDVIRNELSKDYAEIIAQITIDEEQYASGKAEYPIDIRRQTSLCLL